MTFQFQITTETILVLSQVFVCTLVASSIVGAVGTILMEYEQGDEAFILLFGGTILAALAIGASFWVWHTFDHSPIRASNSLLVMMGADGLMGLVLALFYAMARMLRFQANSSLWRRVAVIASIANCYTFVLLFLYALCAAVYLGTQVS